MKHLLLSTCLTLVLTTVAYAPSASYAAAATGTQTVSQKTAADALLNSTTWRSGNEGYKPIPLVYDAAVEKYDVDRIIASLQGRPDAEVQKMLAQNMDLLRPVRQKQIDAYNNAYERGTGTSRSAQDRANVQSMTDTLGLQVDETLAKISADAIKAGVNQATYDKIMQTAATEINTTILTRLLNSAGEQKSYYGNGQLIPTHAADKMVVAEATKNTRTGTTGMVAKPYATRANLSGQAVAVVGFGQGLSEVVNGRTRAIINGGYIETNDTGGYRIFAPVKRCVQKRVGFNMVDTNVCSTVIEPIGAITSNGTLLGKDGLPATGAEREKLLGDYAEYLSVLPAAKGATTSDRAPRTGFTLPAAGSTTALTVDSTGKLRDADGNIVGTMRGASGDRNNCNAAHPSTGPGATISLPSGDDVKKLANDYTVDGRGTVRNPAGKVVALIGEDGHITDAAHKELSAAEKSAIVGLFGGSTSNTTTTGTRESYPQHNGYSAATGDASYSGTSATGSPVTGSTAIPATQKPSAANGGWGFDRNNDGGVLYATGGAQINYTASTGEFRTSYGEVLKGIEHDHFKAILDKMK